MSASNKYTYAKTKRPLYFGALLFRLSSSIHSLDLKAIVRSLCFHQNSSKLTLKELAEYDLDNRNLSNNVLNKKKLENLTNASKNNKVSIYEEL